MGYPDIDLARNRQASLRRLIDEHAGSGADPRRLRRVLVLCAELSDAVDDEYCRRKVLALEEYAAELLSSAVHRARGAMPGADFLRREIRDALELVQSRLYSLERSRRQGQLAALPRLPRFAG